MRTLQYSSLLSHPMAPVQRHPDSLHFAAAPHLDSVLCELLLRRLLHQPLIIVSTDSGHAHLAPPAWNGILGCIHNEEEAPTSEAPKPNDLNLSSAPLHTLHYQRHVWI